MHHTESQDIHAVSQGITWYYEGYQYYMQGTHYNPYIPYILKHIYTSVYKPLINFRVRSLDKTHRRLAKITQRVLDNMRRNRVGFDIRHPIL